MAELELFDAMTLVENKVVTCLDHGFVRLDDCMPRLIPKGRTIDTVGPIKSARTSFGHGLRDLAADINLVRYLIRNHHTSPFEAVEFNFHLKLPIFVARQLMRHRTANVNEFSQRYAEYEDDEFYHPDCITPLQVYGGGIRIQGKVNKQASSSEGATEEALTSIRTSIEESNQLIERLFALYHQMIAQGCAKEIARYCLPVSTYTQLYFKLDLHNLMRLLHLRLDSHAQPEITVYAQAIFDLINPLAPIAIETFFEIKSSITLTPAEVKAIAAQRSTVSSSLSENRSYQGKLALLGLQFP